ncbi:E3 ubiquitin-protein ligase EL5-like [Panicum miliaceum]|uniref:RING-type E3 ubiquitin transferase n=1 Tax=Panicum miliaceum TaxID=4540 RepID=A0A3L6RRU9_PANMI|nr:E3 ubiquitin-protein ligase EL5-like [Panicum miliaceum]
MTHQGASDDSMDSPWPSGGGAAAVPPAAPVAAVTGSVMTAGSIATVAGTILIFVAAPGSKEEQDAAECAVCLAELEDGEAARFLPRCGHGFHAACVDTWLASRTTCPLCRLTVAKPDASPAPALALRPVPPESASYAANLPASVLLGVSDQRAVTAVTVASDGDTSASTGTTGVLVIEIPELAVPAPTPRDAAKSPAGSARPRSFRSLWSFGRQGAGVSSSCSCGGAGEGDDVEQRGATQGSAV